MYPSTHTYTEEYKKMDKSKVVIENLSSSIISYLESIMKSYNELFEGIDSMKFCSYETEHNNWNLEIRGDPSFVDVYIKIADALMLYRYGDRVQVNGWPIGEERRI